MICHIIGCGDSGAEFKPDPHYYVIGVNDAAKFEHHMNELLFLNPPHHFNEGNRLDVIKGSNCNSVICLSTLVGKWSAFFPTVASLPTLQRWAGSYRPLTTYHTNNSPFTAMSYAVNLGFKDIVLWGVDFKDHKHLTAIDCAPAYSEFSQAVKKFGVRIYKGSSKSKLVLEIWKSEQQQ